MLWFFLALLTAFASASEAALAKLWLKEARTLEFIAVPFFYSLPLYIVLLALLPEITIKPGFWTVLVWMVPLNALGSIFTFWAVRLSPLSLSMPFMSFTPIVVIGVAHFFLGETPGAWGVAGIVIVVVGSYILNLDGENRKSFWGPIKAITREPGSMLMLLAATIFGFTAVFGKKLILLSSPMHSAAIFFSIHNSIVVAAFLCTGRVRVPILVKRPFAGAVIGGSMFLHVCCHFWAISMVAAAYMIAIKRMNGLFGVLYGAVVFKERNMRYRMTGVLIMTVGAAIIALLG